MEIFYIDESFREGGIAFPRLRNISPTARFFTRLALDMDDSARPPAILHLEDDSNDAALIQFHLKSKKFACSIAWVSTREEFVKALAAGGFDVILSDYRMPGFDGDQALSYVRENHDHLPFIMLTGELGEDRAIETIKRGATDYVLKGNLARLVPSIERALREARAEAERRRAEAERRRSDAELHDVKDRLAHELRDMQRLHQLSAHLLGDMDPDRMLHRVLEAVIQLLSADKATVQLYDEVSRTLLLKRHIGFSDELEKQYGSVPVGRDCTCGRAIERRERVITEDVHVDERVAGLRTFFRHEGLISCVSTPLLGRDGKVLGMLSAHFKRVYRPDPRELGLLDLYAQQAARVMEYLQETA
jgi:DNA-binding response OmpR family regulator